MSDSTLAGQKAGPLGASAPASERFSRIASFPLIALRWPVRWWRRNLEAGFVGPLFFYDMARLARRGRTNLLRCTYTFGLLALLCFLVFDSFPAQSLQLLSGHDVTLSISQWASFSRQFAVALLSVQAAAILLLTPAYLGSAIAEEKERGTAELLLTTRLSDRQYLLGKLLGRLAHLGLVLLAGLPILCLTRLWGGIDDNLLLAGFAVAALSLLSCGGISILCSIVTRTLLGAVLLAYAAVFLITAMSLLIPSISSLGFVAAWTHETDRQWADWQSQVNSTQQFLGKNSPYLATVPLTPTPDTRLILLQMLAPFTCVHLAIFLLTTTVAIRIVRVNCLMPGASVIKGVPLASQAERPDSASPGENELHRPTPSHLLEPIHDPVLLWKEIYQGAYAGPGPGWLLWKTSLWQPCLFLFVSLALGSTFLLWTRPAAWRAAMAPLNALVTGLTILVAALTCGLLAFRSGAAVSGERERRTLEALLTLPADRGEVLAAKWTGTLLRYRLGIYALLTIWFLGVATGALHPLGLILLFISCGTAFAFLISFGLWLSLVSRNTLWSHMGVASMFLVFFCGGFIPLIDAQLQHGAGEISLAGHVLSVGIIPEHSWWLASFTWLDASGKLTIGGPHPLQALLEVACGASLFGLAAWLFWKLSCRRWEQNLR
jgi:ABC-type transport system involved in multi-copper enzyme maturation permease subunit